MFPTNPIAIDPRVFQPTTTQYATAITPPGMDAPPTLPQYPPGFIQPEMIPQEYKPKESDHFLGPSMQGTGYIEKMPMPYAGIGPVPNYPSNYLFHENIYVDPFVREEIVNYFYYKTLDKWLYSGMLGILGYLKVKDKKVILIDNIDKFDPDTVFDDSINDIKLKVKYIEKHVLTKDTIDEILDRFVRMMQINWMDLQNHSESVEKIIMLFFHKKFKRMIRK